MSEANGTGATPPIGPAPVPMSVNVKSAPGPTPFVLLTITTNVGPQCYWLETDACSALIDLLTKANVHARSGLIIPNEGTT